MMPKVRTLVGTIFLLVLALPFLFMALLRVLDDALIAQTEQTLAAEAVAVGEAYRRIVDPRALDPIADPIDDEHRYHPLTPKLRFSQVREPMRAGRRVRTSTVAGHELHPMLQRMLVRNLTGVRVLDAEGIVVASSSTITGYSLAHFPEVQAALHGDYQPGLWHRHSDGPRPPVTSLSRSADVRVSVAIPVFADPRAPLGSNEKVLGVIYSNRTPLDVEKAIWLWRDKLVLPGVAILAATLLLAVMLTLAISMPLARLQKSAERVAAGEPEAIAIAPLAPQEIQELGGSIRKMRDQLEARADYIREFAANAAHELKTPLTSLRGASELLLEDDEAMSPEQRKRFLSNVHDDAVRMDALVGRILDLARIESTRPSREKIDLAAFLNATVERYRRRGHDLVLSYRASDPMIEMAPEQLESMVSNVVDNAIRHGAGQPVEIGVFDEGSMRAIAVRDRGPKLERGALDRAFERFYSTARNQGGTGLGLAIVKAIAEAHGGSVEARAEDQGATFVLRIPAA
jgi:signal transduction histidine kinase